MRRTGSEQVQLRMRRKDPETVMLSPERLHGRPLREVPDAHRLVLTARHDELMFGMEERGGDIVEVTSASIHLPSLRLAHAPDLDLPVVRSRYNERQRRVERSPVDATVMALEHVLHGREVVEGVERAGRGVRRVLAQTRDVPDAHSLVLGRGHNQVFLWVELC